MGSAFGSGHFANVLDNSLGWMSLVMLGLLCSLFILLLTYMSARFLTLPKLEAWSRFEIFQLVATAVLAVATLSLYKYDITHFNSVEAEQTIVTCVLMVYFFTLATRVAKENPFGFLRRPLFLLQSLSSGSASVASSFAYLFAPASIITTALRSFSVLFALISGKFYFHEKHMYLKAVIFLMVTAGLVLLSVHI